MNNLQVKLEALKAQSYLVDSFKDLAGDRPLDTMVDVQDILEVYSILDFLWLMRQGLFPELKGLVQQLAEWSYRRVSHIVNDTNLGDDAKCCFKESARVAASLVEETECAREIAEFTDRVLDNSFEGIGCEVIKDMKGYTRAVYDKVYVEEEDLAKDKFKQALEAGGWIYD